MALQKDMTIGGNIFNYHKVKSIRICTIGMSITAEIGHYKDKAWRDANPTGNIRREVKIFTDPTLFATVAGLTTLQVFALIYTKIKESHMVASIDTETHEPILDGNGDQVMVESNWYNDCIDITE